MLGLFAAFQSGSPDPRLGTWTLLSAQGTLDPPNQLSILPVHDGLHVAMTGQLHLDFTVSKNGHPAPAPGNLGFDQVTLHRTSRREAEVIEARNGAVVATIHEKISANGSELTATTVSSGRPDEVSVWTRTGGHKLATDLFAGDWTQDPGKTLMAQAPVIRFEADGRGGVRFVGSFNYDARLDGKPYDLRNGPNDTVALRLVDPHTVEAVYRRDNQVTQKDEWQLSMDGQRLTVTTTGTLATGQRFTEKRVFRKQ